MAQNREHETVADIHSGYISDDPVYLQLVVQCTPSGVEKFVKYFEAGIPNRRALHPALAPIGAWRTIYGTYDEITHVYVFDSIEEMERIRGLLWTDPRHLERTALSTSPEPPSAWQASRRSKLMKLTPYSPKQLVAAPTSEISNPAAPAASIMGAPGRIYVQMMVHGTRAVGDFIKHYAAGVTNRRLLSPSLVPLAAWRTIYGSSHYEITHLFVFDSLAEMARLRKILHSDPKQSQHMSVNTSPNPPNNWETDESSKIMKPLPYSQMK